MNLAGPLTSATVFASAFALAARCPAPLLILNRFVLLAAFGFATISLVTLSQQDIQFRRQRQAVRHLKGVPSGQAIFVV
jgi:hypothetical protein